jgi:2-dehydro-3-deoxyphosphogluconate aldolase / (4S)-4-hydroxy-2-oxoglutarate aldolase
MAEATRLDVYNAVLSSGLVPLFYHADHEVALPIVKACSAGGAKVLEFTNRGEKALQVFTRIVDFVATNKLPIILGVGSVLDAPTAAIFIAQGARFIVGPNCNPEIARLCNRRKIAYLPGCASASEISNAEELGVEIVKIFPGETVGGPAFIKAILGPMPWSRIMPTGGVDATNESISSWIKAGACCVGMGSNLIKKELIAASDYDGISQKVTQVLQWIAEARAK